MTADPLEFLHAAHAEAQGIAEAADRDAPGHYPANPIEFILAAQDITSAATEAAERHILSCMPVAVLRRITAERNLIALYEAACGEYEADGPTWDHESTTGRARTTALEDAIRTLAEGWGWAEERTMTS